MLNFFQSGFYALTGHTPFEWQTRLFQEIIAGNWPERCDIPTGLGKTSVMTIWLLALVWKLQQGDITIPRRLVYIVDRRVVVDQATAEAEKLQAKIMDVNATGIPQQIRATLSAACLPASAANPFVISTLRGQFQDNQLWSHDPTRAAVIVGTVDMIGSRLLFSGYGLGKYPQSLQAGLLAQDTLIVLDEAHLCPSFDTLLSNVREYVEKHHLLRPFKVLFLTATGRNSNGRIFPLNTAAETPEAKKRLSSIKTLSFIQTHPASEKPADQKEAFYENVVAQVQDLAKRNQSIVVYVDTVEAILGLEEQLRIVGLKPLVLTGEMRGKERDEFVARNLAPFLGGHQQATQPSVLLTTSCGEVGIDLDGDHIVCDLVFLERMIQRFGRCNRFGTGAGEIRVVLIAEPKYDATLAALQSLPAFGNGFDASPQAVSALFHSGLHTAAFGPVPLTALLDASLLDDWALTSVPRHTKDATGVYQPDYLRPLPAFWLRGLTEEKNTEVHFCWRIDLEYAIDENDALQMAQALPVKPKEIANIAVYRVYRLLTAIQKANFNNPALDRIIAQLPDESWVAFTIADLLAKAKDEDGLCGWTLFLAANLGGLGGDGLPEYKHGTHGVTDVVDDTTFARYIITESNGQFSAQELKASGPTGPIHTFSSIGNWESRFRKKVPTVLEIIELNEQTHVNISGDPANSRERVIYCNLKDRDGRFAYKQVDMTLQEHLDAAERAAREIAQRLALSADLTQAMITAAANHDLGKDRAWWQRYVLGNLKYPALVLAKIKNSSNRNVTLNDYYRHEFGSLVDLQKQQLTDGPTKELVFHLIAAHHGNARPHFESRQYAKMWKEGEKQKSELTALADEVRRRYVTLQQKYGWWVLAYLEALIKCSDIQAS